VIYSWKKIVKNSMPLLTLTVFVEIIAGQILLFNQNILVLFPLFLVSFPVVNGVGGNIGSVLGARLASGLHVGSVKISLKDREMRDGFITSIVLGVISYFILGLIIYYFVFYFMDIRINISVLSFVLVVLFSGFLLVCLLCFVSVVTAFLSFKHGMDPDDVVAPVVTTVGDFMGIVLLFVFVSLIVS
jgi:mgtE-like transporter